ncbi:hypothetical protein PTSG_00588 [Salpingoeca rosetta]|uniref:Uncharacterized protein n=1 Tax=Salpingoeca rosetta (strain ATCC 50818 / BSB-021) TaxID=946362 RepID=F2TWW7_SALR5|nr:uncharacterized protein PTSG_00588 [Salpingoeca rosetta]EGD72563.1 hypothetical protein PTSG_00588 [Salpingoeca rosetta]|eukprot:XP_004999132.1 hypothetical protein PTSG_00588 [Salpingoeca rosetta]
MATFVCSLEDKPLGKKGYLLHAACSGPHIAVAGTSPNIAVHNVETQQRLVLKGHEADVVGLSFDPASPAHLWSASRDGTVKCWDIAEKTCVRTVTVPDDSTPSSFALSSDGACFAVGCELNHMRDAPVYIFAGGLQGPDSPLVSLKNCHSDDVVYIAASDATAQSGSGEALHRFATASTDGLCNVIDADACLEYAQRRGDGVQGGALEKGEQDQADGDFDDASVIVVTINADHSVKRTGFFGPAQEYVYCITHDETLSFWRVPDRKASDMDIDDQDENNSDDDDDNDLVFQLDEPRAILVAAGLPTDYLIDCFYDAASGRLFLASGSDDGHVHISHIGQGQLVPLCALPHVHKDRVRSFKWMPEAGGALATTGEDATMCIFTS